MVRACFTVVSSKSPDFIEVEYGKRIVGMAAYTDSYVLEGTKWLCLQAQITTTAPAHWPSDKTILCSDDHGILN